IYWRLAWASGCSFLLFRRKASLARPTSRIGWGESFYRTASRLTPPRRPPSAFGHQDPNGPTCRWISDNECLVLKSIVKFTWIASRNCCASCTAAPPTRTGRESVRNSMDCATNGWRRRGRSARKPGREFESCKKTSCPSIATPGTAQKALWTPIAKGAATSKHPNSHCFKRSRLIEISEHRTAAMGRSAFYYLNAAFFATMGTGDKALHFGRCCPRRGRVHHRSAGI